ncbi:MAG: hypothetical protein ACFFKA_12895 [Candidatus Thorarchaeota archaeon]
MIEQAEVWNLKYPNKKMNSGDISPSAQIRLHEFIDNYPHFLDGIGSFSGNLYMGNLSFNYIVKRLLDSKKIRSSCYRYPFRGGEVDLDLSGEIELVLIDNLQFSLMTTRDKQICASLIDTLMMKTNFIFLNISRGEEYTSMPHGIFDFIENSYYNIKVSK